MVAAYKGFLPVVYELHGCPHLDINHQDNEGNTALMIAAQAGQLLQYVMPMSWWKLDELLPGLNNSVPGK